MVPEILPNGNHENHTLDAIISYSQNASWGKSRHSLHICSRKLTVYWIQMQKRSQLQKSLACFWQVINIYKLQQYQITSTEIARCIYLGHFNTVWSHNDEAASKSFLALCANSLSTFFSMCSRYNHWAHTVRPYRAFATASSRIMFTDWSSHFSSICQQWRTNSQVYWSWFAVPSRAVQ